MHFLSVVLIDSVLPGELVHMRIKIIVIRNLCCSCLLQAVLSSDSSRCLLPAEEAFDIFGALIACHCFFSS